MEDKDIIQLYWDRCEKAITETKNKYSRFLFHIAGSILQNKQDMEEAENDTYLRVWNAVPTDRPVHFPAYLAKIMRRICIDTYRKQSTDKRGKCEYAVSLDELEECVPGSGDPADEAQIHALSHNIDLFLDTLPSRDRYIFIRRYFYAESIKEIAENLHLTQANVKVILSRTRQKLKSFLIREGYA